MSYAFRSSQRPGQRVPRQRQPANKRGGQYIDPRRFVQKAKTVVANEPVFEPTHLFQDFAVDDRIKANVAKKGYVTPTPIQDGTIPLGLEGRDVIGLANTGTGKTAAFGIPLLHRLLSEPAAKALVIAPTRELAVQIRDELRSLADGCRLTDALLIGGAPINPQLRDLQRKPRIVIGTPGRIKDHRERQSLRLGGFNMVVLDEVDRMLDMGFVQDVRGILERLAPQRQSLFFSATIDERVRGLIETFSKDAVTVSVKTGETSDSVEQDVVRYSSAADKFFRLLELLDDPTVEKAIVFESTQRSVERLHRKLAERGYPADAIHGGKNQNQRQRALDKFKRNEVRFLVATDVAGRGIDVSGITHVINYTQPQTYDDYIHRIGRAGRAGETGFAFTFVES